MTGAQGPVFRSPRVAFGVAALIACAWLNQGPTASRYDELCASKGASSVHDILLRTWLPIAFAYRRSADEELYFSVANAVRGAPYDRDVLINKRGDVPANFLRMPPADGRWHLPYVEVPFEYPAPLLPFVLLPAAIARSFATFALLFGLEMAALLLASIGIVLCACPKSGSEPKSAVQDASPWWLATLMFLAQGGLAVQRLDAVIALLFAVALWAAVRRKPMTLGVAVGLAAAAKILPLLLLPPLLAADRQNWRPRGALVRVSAGLGLGLATGLAPMLATSPAALVELVRFHGARGLQIESSYGTMIGIAHVFGYRLDSAATLSFGSYNLEGSAAKLMASTSPIALGVAIACLAVWLASRTRVGAGERQAGADPQKAPACPERARYVAGAALAALLCIWLFAKVFSPQYLTWAIPFAVAVRHRRISLLLIAAMAIGQVYLRGFYDYVVSLRALGVAALAIRFSVLIVLAFVTAHWLTQRSALRDVVRSQGASAS